MIKIWLICIFKMAAKMAEMCSKWHIFLLTAHNFLCKSLIFSYVSLLGCPEKLCKFSSFAYSKWPPKWLLKSCEHSAHHSFDWKTHFGIYISARVSKEMIKIWLICIFKWLPKWLNCFRCKNVIFSYISLLSPKRW